MEVRVTVQEFIAQAKRRLEVVLNWRSDDFGHDTQELLIAESSALQEVGESYRLALQMLEIAVSSLDKLDTRWRRVEATTSTSYGIVREALTRIAELAEESK